METGQHRHIRRGLAQNLTHPFIQRVSGVQSTKVFRLQRTVIPDDAGIILAFAPFGGLIQQRTPGVENMPTARLADVRSLKLRHHLFNMIYTMSPQAVALPVGQSCAEPQFRHRQPRVRHQGVDIYVLFHERSTANSSSSGSPSRPGT